MKFDIARQPLIPAFLTLLALTAVAMWGAAKRPAAMPQSYSERIAFYLTAAKSAENEESAETAHAAEHTEAAAQPDHPAYNPTLAATGTQPQTTAANGPARDSLALPANPGTNQTIPAASAHTASPEQGTESLQTTHRDRQIAATDSTDTGNSGGDRPHRPSTPGSVSDRHGFRRQYCRKKGNRNRYNGSRQHGYDAEYGRGRPHDGHSRHGDDDSRKSNSIRSRPGSRRTPPRRAVRPHGDPLPGRVARRLRGTPSGQRPLDRRAADPLYRTLHRAAHGAEQPLLGRHVPRHPALRHPALRHG